MIKKGDRVLITGVCGSYWCEGVVLTAANYPKQQFNHETKQVEQIGPDNWYIELTAEAGNIQGPFPCYTYWKQGMDGGEVEVMGEND